MVPSLIALVAAQGTAPVRDLRANLERKYRATVEQQAGDRHEYRVRIKVVAPKKLAEKLLDPRLELSLTNYRGEMGGRKVSVPKIGGGVLGIGTQGLPTGIEVVGPQGPIWLPLLSLYLPASGEDGTFTVEKTDIGAGITLTGKGILWKGNHSADVSIDAIILRGDKEIGKLTLLTTFDAGWWPQRAEGTLVSADGTYRFTLEK